MKTAKEYRMEARAALSNNWGTAIVAFLLFSLLIGAVSGTIVFSIILGGAFVVGYAMLNLQLMREKKMDLAKLFGAMNGESLGSTIAMYVLSQIFIALWSLLFFIPGIVKYYAYSMAPYILADHPEMDGLAAITASKNLMMGKKGKLFCLQLSYIGWILLSSLTLGLLMLWVAPQMEAAKAAFYESIKGELEVSVADTAAPEVIG